MAMQRDLQEALSQGAQMGPAAGAAVAQSAAVPVAAMQQNAAMQQQERQHRQQMELQAAQMRNQMMMQGASIVSDIASSTIGAYSSSKWMDFNIGRLQQRDTGWSNLLKDTMKKIDSGGIGDDMMRALAESGELPMP